VIAGVAAGVVDLDQRGGDVGEEVDGAACGAGGVRRDGRWELGLPDGDLENALEEELDLLTAGVADDRGVVELRATGDDTGVEDGECGFGLDALEGDCAVGAGRGLRAGGDGVAGATGGSEVDDDGGADRRDDVFGPPRELKRPRSCVTPKSGS
jgi:hypothetical protein